MGLLNGKTSDIKLLFKAIENNDDKKVKAILSNDNGTLNINEKNKEGKYPLLLAVKKDNFEMVYSIIDYANKNHIRLTLEENNKTKEYPLVLAAKNNNMKIVNLLIDYANINNIILNVELKDAFFCYPFYYAAKNDNVEMARLFINYAEEKEIIMDINDQTEFSDNPLFRSINQYNAEITELILKYSKKYKLKTKIQCEEKNEVYNYSLFLGLLNEANNNINDKRKQKEKQKYIDFLNQKKRILKKDDKNYSEAVVLYDFKSSNLKELSVCKGDYIVVTDWNISDGWVFGYKINDPNVFGKIPRHIINRCYEDYVEGDLVSAIYDFKGNTPDELDFKKDEYLRVLDWNIKDGWVYGYINGNRQKKGIFPKLFIRRVYYENQNYLPSYEEAVNNKMTA